ncbi:MAG: DMT family transporter [Bacteroidaceae bacterium]|nr:DMT family transporter [Bacteroidaceae bacterium]
MGKKFSNQVLGHLTALLVVMIWGETFVSTKMLLNAGLMPADIFFYRFLLAYVLTWFVSYKRLFCRNLTDELTTFALGVLGGSLYFLTENMALVYSTASNVAILLSSCPLLTALLLSIFYKSERLSKKQIFGSLLAFLGMVMVVLNGQLILHLNPRGDALAIGAAVCWAFYSLLIKRVMHKYSSWFISRKVFFYGLLTILPYYALVSPLNTDVSILTRPVVYGNLLYLGSVASMFCYIIWNWTLSKLGAVKATNYLYLQSLFTMLFASLILHERITWMAIAGAAILILGMIRAERK